MPPIHHALAAKTSSPNAIIARPSSFAPSRDAIGMLTAVAIAPGKSTNPVSVAVKPRTFCRNSGSTSAVPNKPKPVTTPMTLPAENARDLNTLRSTSGRGSYHSLKQNTTRETTATTVSTSIVADENQSSRCPRSSTYCSDATPAVSKPSRCSRSASGRA